MTAEFWQYDSRIGRRWNVDPKPNTSISPYNCFAGNPIWNSDIKGDTIINSVNQATSPDAHARVNTAIADVQKKNPEMFNYLNTLRVSRTGNDFTLLTPGQAGYDKAQNVIININEGDIDGESAADEEKRYKESPFGGTRTYTAGSTHLNGQTNYTDITTFPAIFGDIKKDGTRTLTTNINGTITEIQSSNKNSTQQEYITILSQFNKNIFVGSNTFNITVDDFLNNTRGSTTTSYERGLYGKTVAHELGHAYGILRNLVASLYYRQVMGLPASGHEKGNPNGAEAEKQEQIFEKSKEK